MKHINYSINDHLKKLSDKAFLAQTDLLAHEHRKNSILLLRHLREVEVRKLFVDLRLTSLHKYCLKELKFSEGETQRRLTATKLLTELPEIEGKIETGTLNVTNLSKIQSFLQTENAAAQPLTKGQKQELIDEFQNKSTREVEKELVGRSHQPALLAEKFQGARNSMLLGDEYQKFETSLSKEHQELLMESKNLYAHELNNSGNGEVLVFLLQKAVQYKKKKLGLSEKRTELEAESKSRAKIVSTSTQSSADAAPLPSAAKLKRVPQRKYTFGSGLRLVVNIGILKTKNVVPGNGHLYGPCPAWGSRRI